MKCLQGRVKFPIGGTVRERAGADLVQLQNRQYSLDLKKVYGTGQRNSWLPHFFRPSGTLLC
jgi:hypothetical protein